MSSPSAPTAASRRAGGQDAGRSRCRSWETAPGRSRRTGSPAPREPRRRARPALAHGATPARQGGRGPAAAVRRPLHGDGSTRSRGLGHRPPRRRGRWYLRPGGTPGPATVRAPSDGRLSKAPAYGRSSHPRQGRRSRTWTTFAARMDAAPLPGAITGPHRTGCRPLPLQRRGWGPISAATSAASAGVAASAARSSSAQALGVAGGCGPATRVSADPILSEIRI